MILFITIFVMLLFNWDQARGHSEVREEIIKTRGLGAKWSQAPRLWNRAFCWKVKDSTSFPLSKMVCEWGFQRRACEPNFLTSGMSLRVRGKQSKAAPRKVHFKELQMLLPHFARDSVIYNNARADDDSINTFKTSGPSHSLRVLPCSVFHLGN